MALELRARFEHRIWSAEEGVSRSEKFFKT